MNGFVKMVDVHTHILPAIDDGAADEKEACQMLKALASQRVTTVCLTPHYYHHKESITAFLTRRAEAFQKIEEYASQCELTIFLACEAHLTEDLLNEPDLSMLCINKTRFLLLEAPRDWLFSAKEQFLLERLISRFGILPILAHVERYPPLLKSDSLLSNLLEMGCRMQINLSSLSEGSFLIRRRLIRCLSEDTIHFVGTDCHNMTRRAPEYTRHIDLIEKKLGRKFVEQLQINAKRMLNPSAMKVQL
ncbi:MAG: hypothetical protein LBT44_02035 [Clostridiales bacterium]|nr:hypothetical protein [Clostridiales bacterium]